MMKATQNASAKIPTLGALRAHIKREGWNACTGNTKSLRDMFTGNCHYASSSLSEMLTDDATSKGWSLVVRGWYRGDITTIRPSEGNSNFKPGSKGKEHAQDRKST